jgi:glutathione S-transferase
MYTLYYSPGACSMAIHVALLECNQPVTLEKVNLQEKRTPEFLAVSPRGQVPVLVEDGFVVREGAAILIHILETNKSPLLPASGKERTTALQWLMYANATLHPAYARCFFLMKNGDGEAKDKLMGTAIAMINKNWEEIETQLAKTPWLAGSSITMADILVTVIANWSANFPDPSVFKIGPKTKELFRTVIARPAYKKALETEQVQYKMAA